MSHSNEISDWFFKETEENKPLSSPHLKKVWQSCIYKNLSAELKSTEDYNLKFGLSAAAEIGARTRYLLPAVGITYNKANLSYGVE